MRTLILLIALVTTNLTLGFSNSSAIAGQANNTLPAEGIFEDKMIEVQLDIKIINTEEVASEFFYYDIVGLEEDATVEFLTSGATKDLTSLTANLKLTKTYVRIGIKLRWEKEAKYFLFDRNELTYGMIDLSKGKE
ncbi:MAG: hypothetical protein AB8F74_22525 [Saprospiraceae bacterium]